MIEHSLILQDLLQIDNVFNSDGFSESDLTTFFLNYKVINLMESESRSHAYISIHPTNITGNYYPATPHLKNLSTKTNTHIFAEDVGPIFLKKPFLQKYYDGNFKKKIVNLPKYVSGRHLFLLIFPPLDENLQGERPEVVDRIINCIRLVYGIGAAGAPVFEGHYNNENKTYRIATPSLSEFPEESETGRDLSSFLDFDSSINVDDFYLSPDADVLFNRALLEAHPESRFLFFWLCFECMVKGKDRRALYEEKLSSPVANAEVNRLRDLRNSIAHEGKAEVNLQDCTSILWAIRIAVCPNEVTQRELCSKYEAWATSE